MEGITIKHRHHYVFQAYLRTWAKNGQIWCSRNNKIFLTNTVNIAQERDFYRMQDINPDEKKFLSLFLHNQPREAAEIMQKQIAIHEKVLHWRKLVDRLASSTQEVLYHGQAFPSEINDLFLQGQKFAEASANDMLEEIYSEEESDLAQMLAMLMEGNLKFYYEPYSANKSEFDNTKRAFLYYLSSQHFRTKATRKRLIMGLNNILSNNDIKKLGINSTNIRPEHIAHHILWFTGCQVADGLYENDAHLTLLHNHTRTSFITADQPIINLCGNYQNIMNRVDNLIFYYPISPRLAITVNDGNLTNRITLSADNVDHYNKAIAAAKFESIFGDSRSALDRYLE